MKSYIAFLLSFLIATMPLASFAQETGPADTVLRVPTTGGKGRYGALNLSGTNATTGYLGVSKLNGFTSSACLFGNSTGYLLQEATSNCYWDLTNKILSLGSATPNTSAAFQIASTTKGFLSPRMTNAQMNAITTPATGLQVYNTTTNTLYVYNGTSWVSVGSGGGGAAGAVELLSNFSFEGGSATYGWTVSGGTATLIQPGTTGFLFGAGTAKWQASASGQTFQSGAQTIYGLANAQCSAQIYYTYAGTSGDYTLSVSNGSSTLNSIPLPANSYGDIPITITFGCGTTSASTLNWILTSNVASPSGIFFDNVHLGSLVTGLTSGAQPVTITRLTSGSGTYTPPVGVTQIEVFMVGGGGGGGGSGSGSSVSGTAGGNTTFGTSMLVANGGAGGQSNTAGGNGGAGGTTSVTGASTVVALTGGIGGAQASNAANVGGFGASTPFAGAGSGSNLALAGASAVPNTGSGGGGAGGSSSGASGAGGGAGGYIDAVVVSPTGSYAYSVGTAGGSGAGAGTNAAAGGAGASGVIIIKETYNALGAAFPATNGGLNPGDEVITAMSQCPIGTIKEDGASYATSAYPQLFSAIGYTYGGSGANFNVPNAQGLAERASGTQTAYFFTVASSSVTAGAVYSNNSQTFVASGSTTSSTLLSAFGSGAPLTSGTLTLVSGTGPSTIAFTAFTSQVYSATQGLSQLDMMQSHIHTMPAWLENPGAGGTGVVGDSPGSGSAGTRSTSVPVTDGTNGTPRVGAETRPASISHLHCIRTGYAAGAGTIVGAVQSSDNMNGITVINTSVTYISSATLPSSVETALVNATSAAITMTLPDASLNKSKRFIIRKTDSSANLITLATTSSQTINGQASGVYKMGTQFDSMSVVSDGANWQIDTYNVTVAASYVLSTGFTTTTSIPINFDVKEFDVLNTVTPSTTAWKFTSPVPGTYSFVLGGNSNSSSSYIRLYKNGSFYKTCGYINNTASLQNACLAKLSTNDYVDFRAVSSLNITGGSLVTDGAGTINILRVAN